MALWVSLFPVLFLILVASAQRPTRSGAAEHQPFTRLAYLKQVNQWRPPTDPQLHFLLMGQFANAGRHARGHRPIFEDALKRFGPQLATTRKRNYLLAIASLRAGHANDVFLLKRYRLGARHDGAARRRQAPEHGPPDVRLALDVGSGPGAVARLLPQATRRSPTCHGALTMSALAPHRDWLREVYSKLSDVHRARGDAAQARATSL